MEELSNELELLRTELKYLDNITDIMKKENEILKCFSKIKEEEF